MKKWLALLALLLAFSTSAFADTETKQGVTVGTVSGASGDVTANAGNFANDNRLMRVNCPTGACKEIQQSTVTLDDTGNLTGIATVTTNRRSDQGDQWTAYEDSDNGDNYIGMKAPDAITTNAVFIIGGTGPPIEKASSGSLNADEVMGRIITNRGQAGAVELELPTAAAQMNFIGVNITATAGRTFAFDPAAGDKIYLDGTALDDGDKVIIGVGVGKGVSCFTFTTDGTNYDWVCTTIGTAGSVTDGGA